MVTIGSKSSLVGPVSDFRRLSVPMNQFLYNEFDVECVKLDMQGEIPIIKGEKQVKDGEMPLRTFTIVKIN